jgi:hypothetical protein
MPNWKKVLTSGSAGELSSLYAPSITGSLLGTASYAIYAETASISNSTTLTQLLVLNQAGFTINKGAVVRITGSNNASDVPRITTASYEDDGVSANTLGIASTQITNGNTGYVITEGVLTGIDTSGWSSGTLLFLGATGSITASAPQAPLHAVRLGQVIREQNNNGSIHVRVDNGYELNELHDVNETTTTASYGDLLVKSGSVWTNSKQLTGSYGLTGSLTATSFTGSLQGTASFASTAQTASYINVTNTSLANNYYMLGIDSDNVSNTPEQLYNLGVTYNPDTLAFTVASGNGNIYGYLAGTSSWAQNVVSSSHALTASYALNATAGNTFPYTGSAIITGSLGVTGSVSITQNITGSRAYLSASIGTVSGSTLVVYGSGSANPVFTVQGSQGELFSVSDTLSGSLFSVNDISGLPILEVFSDNTTLIGSYQDPMLITTTKLVTTASGAFTLYSLPTASYDTAFFEYSIRSGSNARAGSIMAIQSASAVNFTETTTTDFGSTSGFAFTVQVAGANMILTGSATTSGWTIKTIVRSI